MTLCRGQNGAAPSIPLDAHQHVPHVRARLERRSIGGKSLCRGDGVEHFAGHVDIRAVGEGDGCGGGDGGGDAAGVGLGRDMGVEAVIARRLGIGDVVGGGRKPFGLGLHARNRNVHHRRQTHRHHPRNPMDAFYGKSFKEG